MNQKEECCNPGPESDALSGFCQEQDLLENFGIKKSTLSTLRQTKGFPYIKITKNERMYYLPDVREWLLTQRWNLKR
jgi:hypothetical protein